MIRATLDSQPTWLTWAFVSHASGCNFPEQGLSAPRLHTASPHHHPRTPPLPTAILLPLVKPSSHSQFVIYSW